MARAQAGSRAMPPPRGSGLAPGFIMYGTE